MKKKETLIIILLCFISRLPQLLSNNLMLDGDECIVAIMAKHFYEGKDLSFYFYGQSYGFSFIEMLFIDLHYFLFGISDISVRLAMLMMWTIGVVLFYKTLILLNLRNSMIPFCITLIFIFAPAWAVWSMKARGGYLTAFLLCFLITSLIFNNDLIKKSWMWLLTGLLTALLFESQLFWLPGLIPVIFYKSYISGKKKNLFIFIGTALSFILIFWTFKTGLTNVWHPEVFDLSSGVWHPVKDLVRRVFVNLTGSYYLAWTITPHVITNIWAIAFIILMIFTSVALLIFFLKKQMSPSRYILGLSFLFSLSYILLLGDNSARYLLPLTGYFLLLLAVMADQISMKFLIICTTACFVVTGAASLYTFKDFRYKAHTKTNIVHLINELTSRNIHYTFCGNALLEWQIIFYSDENICARFSTAGERYPENLRIVNMAFRKHREQTAVIGTIMERSLSWKSFINVDQLFFINVNPSSILLSNYGYSLCNPK